MSLFPCYKWEGAKMQISRPNPKRWPRRGSPLMLPSAAVASVFFQALHGPQKGTRRGLGYSSFPAPGFRNNHGKIYITSNLPLNHFSLHSSVIWSLFMLLCRQHHYPSPELSSPSKTKTPYPLNMTSLCPLPGLLAPATLLPVSMNLRYLMQVELCSIFLFVTLWSFLIKNKNSRAPVGLDKPRNVLSGFLAPQVMLPSSPPMTRLQTSCFSHLEALLGCRSWSRWGGGSAVWRGRRDGEGAAGSSSILSR